MSSRYEGWANTPIEGLPRPSDLYQTVDFQKMTDLASHAPLDE